MLKRRVRVPVPRSLLAVVMLAGATRLLVAPSAAQAQCVFPPQWQQIGPGPLMINPTDGADGQGPDSGMVRDIAIDPNGTSDQVIYVATDNGGIWKTTDGGLDWFPMTDSMPSLNMGAMALDPASPAIVYAGTGNEHSQNFLSKGVGIYKSMDGGQTWTILGGNVLANRAINRIVLPAPSVLLLATDIGVYRSVDGGAHFDNNGPLFDHAVPNRCREVL